jgi:hypothetical protein
MIAVNFLFSQLKQKHIHYISGKRVEYVKRRLEIMSSDVLNDVFLSRNLIDAQHYCRIGWKTFMSLTT